MRWLPPSLEALLEGQLAVVCDEAVPVFSFTFGIPPLDKVQATGAVIMGTATTVDEAVALEQAGVDVVVAQGAEAGGHPVHRAALSRSPDTGTCITAAYSGRPARALRTTLIRDLETLPGPLEFPLQYARTAPIHYAAAEAGDEDLMFLLAGQAAGLARPLPAAELVETLVKETEAVIAAR